MKSLGLGLLHLTLLTLLFSCGKNNQSGKNSNSWGYTNPYLGGNSPLLNINSPYSYGGMSINQVMQQNPCRGGYNGVPGYTNQVYAGQRIPIQVPLTNFPTVIPPNDIYVGVTTFGDVGVVVGQAINQPPLFVGYMCPRSFSPSGQGQLMGVKIGSYSNCLFKPITASTVVFPGGATAEFRWMDGGSSIGAKFSFCR
jgi:hypothetical protein